MYKYFRLLFVVAFSLFFTLFFIFSLPKHAIKSQSSISESNSSTTSGKRLSNTDALTIVINEVAWGGTGASPFDEWIELYNNSPMTHSLQDWRLYALDGGPDISLVGSINPYEYFLIERTDDTSVSDIAADLISSFGNGLNNTGDVLILSLPDETVMDTANISGGSWPNNGDTHYSMERIDPGQLDIESNWASNNGTIYNGLDANGNAIYGTPKSRNSANYTLPAQSDLVITKQGPGQIDSNDLITYTFIISNAGSITANDTIITDTFPKYTIFFSQNSLFLPTLSENKIVWYAGAISPSLRHTWTLTLLLSDTIHQQVTNRVTCTTTSTESNLTNNFDSVTTHAGGLGIVISSLLFDGYQLYDEDEAIEITNPTDSSVDLYNWEICKSSSGSLYCVNIPAIILSAHQNLWVAKNQTAFEASFGHPPDIVLSPWINMPNDGGILYLRDTENNYVDTLKYGDAVEQAMGWSGVSVKRYYNNLRGMVGQILTRIPHEITGLPILDTDTYLDWMQNTGNPVYGRRVWYPGWVKNPFFWPVSAIEHAQLIVGVAPDNAFEVISQTILKAQNSISIEVYTFNNPHLLPALIQKANEGVSIKILLEGDPVGISELSTEWQTQLYICSEIENAGGECWFMIHDSDQAIFNRYEYLHTKMMLIDNAWLVIGSQNYSRKSLPSDDKTNGTFGTRGCIIATTAPTIIARAGEIFTHDSDETHYTDLLRWNTGNDTRYGDYLPEFVDLSAIDYVTYTTRFTNPFVLQSTNEYEIFSAPESALRQSDALLGLLNKAGAEDVILVEEMYEYASWGTDSDAAPNLRLNAFIDAARRGARVRILLNGQGFGIDSTLIPERNLETVTYVNAIAQEEKLNLQAATGNPTGNGIHNKMILVNLSDEGQYSHIGSINGSEHSNKVNREVAIHIKSQPLFTYLEKLFELDWWLSNPVYLPMIVRKFTSPAPPVNHLVISEVFYGTNAAEEWIELYNPTNDDVDLNGWKIGDAEAPDSFEAMFQFPVSSTIKAHDTLVIAVNASEVYLADFEFYESDVTVRNMIPDPDWGSIEYPLSLRDTGDQVLLLDVSYTIIDSVVWGDAYLAGINAHPGKINISASLERFPVYYDTDNCLIDFRERYPPTPNEIPN